MSLPRNDAPTWLKCSTLTLFVGAMVAWGVFLSWLQATYATWAPLLTLPPLFAWGLWYSFRHEPPEWREHDRQLLKDIWRRLTFRRPSAPLLPPANAATRLGRWIFAGLMLLAFSATIWNPA